MPRKLKSIRSGEVGITHAAFLQVHICLTNVILFSVKESCIRKTGMYKKVQKKN